MKPTSRYQPSDKIGGRYLVHQALMGGMGEVYLCLDLEYNYPYALKTFQQRYLGGSRLREAFKQEVATWVALEKHPNIVRCFWMEILDNQPFMVLEWIAGEEGRGTDLRSWLRRGSLDLRTTLDFTIDICRGLLHAQQKQPGIVHRDLKPENILVAQGRLAKISDFGLATIVQAAGLKLPDMENTGDEHQSLFGRGGVVGTPPYMAPEQWDGQTGDTRTDIYAIGCILYELLTGNWPYQATTSDGLRRQHKEAAIPKLENALPAALNPLLAHCLAKRPEERPANVDDLLEELTYLYQQHFAEAPKSIPDTAEFTAADYGNRGNTYASLQRYEEALRDYTRAIELAPRDALAYFNRGLTYNNLQRYDEALRDYSWAIEFDPRDAMAYSNRGNTYARLQRYDEALRDFSQAIELEPRYALAYSNRGLTYANLQRYDEALRDHIRAIELDPQFAQAYCNRGLTYDALQHYDEALHDYTQAIELNPHLVQAYYNRGLIYYHLRQYDKALRDYTWALELNPHLAQAYYNRGLIYRVLQRYDEALPDFTRVIELDPRHVLAYSNRGLIYHALQRYDEALPDFTRVIELDPNFAPAYLNAGISFAEQSRLREALPYFEQAAELGDSQGAVNAVRARQELAFEAFQAVGSLADMQAAVARFLFMTNAEFINAVEQAIHQQVPPEHQPAFAQRLAWLCQIANEQKGKENTQ